MLSKYSRCSTILKQASKTASRAMSTVRQPLGYKYEANARSAEWSETLSFATPESDFSASDDTKRFSESTPPLEDSHIWSESLSFASPESDFVSTQARDGKQSATGPIWSESLSFASPEADFTAEKADCLLGLYGASLFPLQVQKLISPLLVV